MGRFSKHIPSVRQFQQSAPIQNKPFDRERAIQVLRDGISLLNSYYPTGALEWLRENRQDVMKYLKESFKTINTAIASEDQAAVCAAVETAINYHCKAFEIFSARPPVIEVQGELI